MFIKIRHNISFHFLPQSHLYDHFVEKTIFTWKKKKRKKAASISIEQNMNTRKAFITVIKHRSFFV